MHVKLHIYFVGFTFSSFISLYCCFWFLFTLHLFLRISNPIRMSRFERSKHAKKVHIIEVVCVVLLTTVPKFVFAVRQEFRIVTFPPTICGASPTRNFYGNILPTIVVSCATLIMMVIILYNIHIVSCYLASHTATSLLLAIYTSCASVGTSRDLYFVNSKILKYHYSFLH